MHPVGTLPTVKMHPVGTVLTVKMHPVGSLPWMKILDFWPYKWILWLKKMTARDVYFSAQGVQDLCFDPLLCVCLSLQPIGCDHSFWRFIGASFFKIWTEIYWEGYCRPNPTGEGINTHTYKGVRTQVLYPLSWKINIACGHFFHPKNPFIGSNI